jgi:prefoldin subunit 2
VQRTVAETLPAVQRNKESIDTVIKKLNEQLEARKKEMSEFQVRCAAARVQLEPGRGLAGSSLAARSAGQALGSVPGGALRWFPAALCI